MAGVLRRCAGGVRRLLGGGAWPARPGLSWPTSRTGSSRSPCSSSVGVALRNAARCGSSSCASQLSASPCRCTACEMRSRQVTWMTNRPGGLLMNQPNLFGGYLAMYAFVLLFVARTRALTRVASLFLTTVGLLMVVTLGFTLSRGAWLAFAATTMVVGLLASRGVVLLLALAIFAGYQWAPEEATERTEMTVQGVGGDAGLVEGLDDSTALRVMQWQTFPQIFATSPIFGTGLHTYENELKKVTGIHFAAHATPIQLGVETGAVGLVGYLGLLGAIALTCLRRARASSKGSLQRSLGLGLLAATICLGLLDLSGARFQEHTVTTFYFLLLGAFVGNTDRLRGGKMPPASPGRPLRRPLKPLQNQA